MIIDVVVHGVVEIKLRCFLFTLVVIFKLVIKHVTALSTERSLRRILLRYRDGEIISLTFLNFINMMQKHFFSIIDHETEKLHQVSKLCDKELSYCTPHDTNPFLLSFKYQNFKYRNIIITLPLESTSGL